jgi:hypothetical protein
VNLPPPFTGREIAELVGPAAHDDDDVRVGFRPAWGAAAASARDARSRRDFAIMVKDFLWPGTKSWRGEER